MIKLPNYYYSRNNYINGKSSKTYATIRLKFTKLTGIILDDWLKV